MPDLEPEPMANATRMIATLLRERVPIWRRFGII
jgi:hypothetical protein